ncbi:MAG TPA: HPr(Ser) kinase/phosphatase [Myxococcales bacterium]|nr:HPr(Ser) kinase/phosphatase [Myxococcales bacterium]
MQSLKIGALLEDAQFDLRIELVAGAPGLSRRISSSRVQKPGLALAGFLGHLHRERLQVFGNTEISFLATLPPERQAQVVKDLFSADIAGLCVTKNLDVPRVLVEAAEASEIPLFRTKHLSSTFIANVERFLEDALTQSTSLHGVLVDVLGVGVLILGKSGIGKSECALDLVLRGHRLVADDIVDVKRKGDSVVGAGSAIIKHHMEIRGIGIINIKDLFGVAAVRDHKKIEVVVELMEWDPAVEYDRLGVEERKFTVLDVEVPMLVVPVRPGRNMTTIIEVAARNQLLKLQGHHSALEFQEKLNRAIAEGQTRQAVGGEVE